jgi:DNA-binding NarL/FixJ family response regulator
MLLQGLSVHDIADAMGLNSKTVANHQSSIKQKLGAETPIQLAQIGGALIQDAQRRR